MYNIYNMRERRGEERRGERERVTFLLIYIL
jgi:hypothetical protein